jgi:hypothetical protein
MLKGLNFFLRMVFLQNKPNHNANQRCEKTPNRNDKSLIKQGGNDIRQKYKTTKGPHVFHFGEKRRKNGYDDVNNASEPRDLLWVLLNV